MKLCLLCGWLCRGLGFETIMGLFGLCESSFMGWDRREDGLFGDGGTRCGLVDEGMMGGKGKVGKIGGLRRKEAMG